MLKTGIPAAGGIAVFITTRWPGEELAYGLDNSSIKTIFADAARSKWLIPLKSKKPYAYWHAWWWRHFGSNLSKIVQENWPTCRPEHGIQKMTIFNTYLSGPQATPQAWSKCILAQSASWYKDQVSKFWRPNKAESLSPVATTKFSLLPLCSTSR